jgi:membrane-associated PAP2 superfamily phosphatase
MDEFRASIQRGDEALERERIALAFSSRAARAAPGKCVPTLPASSDFLVVYTYVYCVGHCSRLMFLGNHTALHLECSVRWHLCLQDQLEFEE